MAPHSLEQEITSQVARLAADQQRRVLEYARSLARTRPDGVSGKRLTKFAGCVSSEDLDQMAAAIEEGCARVVADAW